MFQKMPKSRRFSWFLVSITLTFLHTEQAARRKQDSSLSPISAKDYIDDLVDQFENAR